MFDVRSDRYFDVVGKHIVEHFFAQEPEEYKKSEQFKLDIDEHLARRYERIRDHVVPWVQSKFDLAGSTLVEVGSGTGSATLAFAPHVGKVLSYDIDEKSMRAARERLDFFGVENVSFEGELFDANSRFNRQRQIADVVLLYAVLEHMTFDELEAALWWSWQCLRPGGILIVAETPNRLAPMDYHTSHMPFFQWLPPEVQRRYYWASPRVEFYNSLKGMEHASQEEFDLFLTRWGRGISFHEFEIVLGRGFHNCIIADGYEPEIASIAEHYDDDEILQLIFERKKLDISRAFARWFLYFIAEKAAEG